MNRREFLASVGCAGGASALFTVAEKSVASNSTTDLLKPIHLFDKISLRNWDGRYKLEDGSYILVPRRHIESFKHIETLVEADIIKMFEMSVFRWKQVAGGRLDEIAYRMALALNCRPKDLMVCKIGQQVFGVSKNDNPCLAINHNVFAYNSKTRKRIYDFGLIIKDNKKVVTGRII